jgi:type II secretory pathway pseudopilin PulG
MSQQVKTALAVVAIVAGAAAFWLLLLSPKRDKADELSAQVTTAKSTLSTENRRAAKGLAAKKKFRHDYQQLILLGKAVPADAETASLLVQLNAVSRPTATPFLAIASEGGGGSESSESDVPATTIDLEPPLGSSVGPAGFRAMPVKVGYEGGYFGLVELLKHVNGMVTTKDGRVIANGRLVTISSFVLQPKGNFVGFNKVGGVFHLTSYTTPPDQGLTAGATPLGPAAAGGTQ